MEGEPVGVREARDEVGDAASLVALDDVLEREDRWIDERVPALGGLTPRQAAGEPTRRAQLETLLRELDRQQPRPGVLTFDVGRIRAALGLE